jgi:hypothetical protein
MQHEYQWGRRGADDDAANRRTASLGGLAISLLLLVIGLFLVRELHAMTTYDVCMTAYWLN